MNGILVYSKESLFGEAEVFPSLQSINRQRRPNQDFKRLYDPGLIIEVKIKIPGELTKYKSSFFPEETYLESKKQNIRTTYLKCFS